MKWWRTKTNPKSWTHRLPSDSIVRPFPDWIFKCCSQLHPVSSPLPCLSRGPTDCDNNRFRRRIRLLLLLSFHLGFPQTLECFLSGQDKVCFPTNSGSLSSLFAMRVQSWFGYSQRVRKIYFNFFPCCKGSLIIVFTFLSSKNKDH